LLHERSGNFAIPNMQKESVNTEAGKNWPGLIRNWGKYWGKWGKWK